MCSATEPQLLPKETLKNENHFPFCAGNVYTCQTHIASTAGMFPRHALHISSCLLRGSEQLIYSSQAVWNPGSLQSQTCLASTAEWCDVPSSGDSPSKSIQEGRQVWIIHMWWNTCNFLPGRIVCVAIATSYVCMEKLEHKNVIWKAVAQGQLTRSEWKAKVISITMSILLPSSSKIVQISFRDCCMIMPTKQLCGTQQLIWLSCSLLQCEVISWKFPSMLSTCRRIRNWSLVPIALCNQHRAYDSLSREVHISVVRCTSVQVLML